MKLLNVILVIGMLGGCKSAPPYETKRDDMTKLTEATAYMEKGEFYRARRLTGSVLEQDPAHPEAHALMVQILTSAVAREKEIYSGEPAAELNRSETNARAEAWLERAGTLLGLGEYDQALDAAETVFLYDPENVRASRLIDRIWREGWVSGKRERQILGRISREEIDERVADYRRTAERGFASGEFGPALLAVEKILILYPQDADALRLREEILRKRERG
jgi:tetratricopeptide (TPR) repeat protein